MEYEMNDAIAQTDVVMSKMLKNYLTRGYAPGTAPPVQLVRFSPDHFLLKFIIHR